MHITSKTYHLQFKAQYQMDKQQTYLLFTGPKVYYEILTAKLSNRIVIMPDQYYGFDWACYVHNVHNRNQHDDICNFLARYQDAVYIDSDAEQTFALDYHIQMGMGRTEIGELVYQAKYSKTNSAIEEISKRMTEFIAQHPMYSRADYVISAPYINKSFDLPEKIVEFLCLTLNKSNGNEYIRKIRQTKPTKDIEDINEKAVNIRGAFELVEGHSFLRKRILVIDDLLRSGTTLSEITYILQEVEAQVYNLVATKTIRD